MINLKRSGLTVLLLSMITSAANAHSLDATPGAEKEGYSVLSTPSDVIYTAKTNVLHSFVNYLVSNVPSCEKLSVSQAAGNENNCSQVGQVVEFLLADEGSLSLSVEQNDDTSSNSKKAFDAIIDEAAPLFLSGEGSIPIFIDESENACEASNEGISFFMEETEPLSLFNNDSVITVTPEPDSFYTVYFP